MKRLSFAAFTLIAASQTYAVEYLNIDNGPQSWAINASASVAESDKLQKDYLNGEQERSDENANSQMLFVEYRQDLFQLALATSQYTQDDGEDKETDRAFHFKAGSLFQRDDGTALALNIIGDFENDKDKSDTMKYRISAGRHLDKFSGEINISHYQHTGSDSLKPFFQNELGYAMKYQYSQYLSFVTYGLGSVANNIKSKNIGSKVEALNYQFGFGIGSNPLPNLDLLFQVAFDNINLEVRENGTNTKQLTSDEDSIVSQITAAIYF